MNAEVSRGPEAADLKRTRILQASPLFASLSDEALAQLLGSTQLLTLERRHAIDSADVPAALYVVGQGRLRLSRQTASDRYLTLGYYGPGEIVGERALVPEAEKTELVATELSVVVRIPIDLLRTLLGQETSFAAGMVQLLASRRIDAERRLEDILTRSVEERISHLLADLAESHGVPHEHGTLLAVRLTHQEIAAYVGSTRETVTVLLTDLKRRGAITFDRRHVVVIDTKALQGSAAQSGVFAKYDAEAEEGLEVVVKPRKRRA